METLQKSVRTALISGGLLTLLFGCGCDRHDNGPTTVVPESVSPEVEKRLPKRSSVADQLEIAQRTRKQGAPEEAWEIVQRVLVAEPNQSDALVLAAELQREQGNFDEAVELAMRAAEQDPSLLTSMTLFTFGCQISAQDYAAAEKSLKQALEQDTHSASIYRYLAQLLNAQGRRVEASRYVRELIRLRAIQPNELLSLVDLRGPFNLASFADVRDGDDLTLFKLGEIRYRYSTERGAPDPFLEEIDRVITAFPESTTAYALRCRILADSDRFETLRASLASLPEAVSDQPEYWYAVGVLSAHDGFDEEAIRAYAEALARDPTDRESLRSMIASFVSMGKSDEILLLRKRLAELDRVFRIARDADQEQALEVSKTLQSQVRPWEATAWLMQAAKISGNVQSIIPELDRRLAQIAQWQKGANEEQLINVRLKSMLGFGRSDWPLPDIKRVPRSDRVAVSSQSESPLRMINVAEQVGIAVPFESGFPSDGGEFAPYQVNGAGLAAIDFDLDGRCDVYMMQSGGSPLDEGSSKPNQMFRLSQKGQFEDVSGVSKTGDRRFAQGVSAGDVNQDGFPDLLLANIGTNGILLNQGDGTFVPADELLADNPFAWTSSIALADLDGDHLPEVFEVNYVDDDNVYTRRCSQNYLDCQPQVFDKGQDRILQMNAEGSLRPWQAFADSSPLPRLGFGLVIANFDESHGNDVFISNDGDFNHFWSSGASAVKGEEYRLSEAASISGCSIGRGGRSQACMGVASGDFDRNGMLDLHVTNFRNEPVNLFLLSKSGVFVDQAAAFRLAKPSFGVLGFGTQAADLNNDGWSDLVVLNGHVYDARFEGTPFQMRPQLFRGQESGFMPDQAEAENGYWAREAVGRTLMTLDWNRDGGMDCVATHLDQPVALLQNESDRKNWLQLELVGVESERDAIGAKVHVRANENAWAQWQIGGDGLMCSNESVLHFGLGETNQIDDIEVSWPSGRRQNFAGIKVGMRYLIIEGVDQPIPRLDAPGR